MDFESLPEGQPASTRVPGLSFTNATVLQAAASLNEVEYPPRSGKQVVCDVGGPMSISFTSPITSLGGFFTHQKSITIQALSITGATLATTTSSNGALGSSESLQLNWNGPATKVVIKSDAAGSSFTLDDLSYTIFSGPPPTFSLDYTHLSFDAVIGRAAPPAQTITVTADPDVNFTVASSAPLLKVSRTSAKTPAAVAVFVDPTGLTDGNYVGILLFTGPKTDTIAVQVVLHVVGKPQLTATPKSFTFTWKAGDPLPAAQKLFIGALNANVDYFTMTKDPWVTTNPTFATTGLVGFSLAVTVDPSKLAPGHYDSAVYVYATEASNSPLTITIGLDVKPGV